MFLKQSFDSLTVLGAVEPCLPACALIAATGAGPAELDDAEEEAASPPAAALAGPAEEGCEEEGREYRCAQFDFTSSRCS